MFIKIKVYPSSKEEKIIKRAQDRYDVYVREKAEMGHANKALMKILSRYFGQPEGNIRFIKGARRRNKIIKI